MRLPPFHWWRTVFVLIPVLGLCTIGLGTVSLLAGLVDGRGRLAHRCAQWWSRAILWTSGVRLSLQGARLPADRTPCLFVANHASFYDIPIVFTAVPRQLRIMAKASLAYVPFIGWHLMRSGHVLVNRHTPGAGIYKRMQRMARSGASLIVFPEGGRTTTDALLPFKAGIFLLAIEHQLPVVPLTVVGARDVMPKGRLMVLPAAVTVTVHPPIATDGLGRADARALARRTQDVIASALRVSP